MSASRRAGSAAQRSTVSSGATAGSAASGVSSAGTASGTPDGEQGPPQRGQRAGHRPHDHRHPRPRHPVLQVRAAQPVGGRGGLASGGGEDVDGDAAVLLVRPFLRGRRRPRPARPGAGQRGDDAGDGTAQGGAAAVVGAQDDGGQASRIGVAQQRRVGPAEAEHRGVGVAREHPVVGGGAERAGELDLLGVHVLDVVDDEVAHGGALGLEQVRVGDEGVEHGRDQLGGVERGR